MRRTFVHLHRTGVLLASIAAAAPVQPSSAQQPARHRVAGFVSDSQNVPVPDARVVLTTVGGLQHYLLSDERGHFAFLAVPAGKTELSVRRLGFQPSTRSMTVGGGANGAADSVRIVLTPFVRQLAAVNVQEKVKEGNGAPAEFYSRMESNHFGHFLDFDALERSQARFLSDALRMVPGVQVLPSRRIGYVVRIRGCRPTVWIDGVRAAGAEVDEVATMADISGVEIYRSIAGMPPQYVDRDNPCGGILVWSRTR